MLKVVTLIVTDEPGGHQLHTAGYLHSVFPLYGKMTSLSYNKIH
jgi:hypothetical protein